MVTHNIKSFEKGPLLKSTLTKQKESSKKRCKIMKLSNVWKRKANSPTLQEMRSLHQHCSELSVMMDVSWTCTVQCDSYQSRNSYWALEMWLTSLKNWIFSFIKKLNFSFYLISFNLNLNSHMWLMTSRLERTGLENKRINCLQERHQVKIK